METYKKEFIEFMVRSGVLTFGDFTTKSGRKTPYFINTGNYRTGEQIAKLGQFYARALEATCAGTYDVLYGPAYKGIPLVVTTAIALSEKHGLSVPYCFNRKEAKDHGEGGTMIGHKVRDNDRIVIIDDVTTAGTSARESVSLLTQAAKVSFTALMVSVDRMEKGLGEKSAIQEIRDSLGINAFAIVTLQDIVDALYMCPVDGRVVLNEQIKEKIDEYRKQYGCKP